MRSPLLIPEPDAPNRERRCDQDRRRLSPYAHLFSRAHRRRSIGRRRTDRVGYVDIYDIRSWGIALAVLLLSLLDAVLTGLQIVNGTTSEANPLMNVALTRGGIYTFFGVKAAMTAFPLALLILHKEWLLARYAARLCLWSYVLVSLYHLYLVMGFARHTAL